MREVENQEGRILEVREVGISWREVVKWEKQEANKKNNIGGVKCTRVLEFFLGWILELRGSASCWSAGAKLGTVERENAEIRLL